MRLWQELGRTTVLLFITAVLVAFLWQAPGWFAIVLIIPLALSIWFWPEGSTILSYIVGALIGSLLTTGSYVSAVARPDQFPAWLFWLPFVWGPAGVIIKRYELMVVEMWSRKKK